MTRLLLLLRRLLALALLAIPLVLVWLTAAGPAVSRLSDLQSQIQQERQLAGRLTASASEAKDIEAAPAPPSMRNLAIEGASEPIRTAALQSQLAEIAGRNGLKPRSSRSLPVREKGGVRLLGVQIQLLATVDKLQTLILDIERHQPVLMISAMQVTPSVATRGAGGDATRVVDARLDVVAMEAR